MPGISRESALGSHSPYAVPKLQDAGNFLEATFVEPTPRLRRASLPSVVLDGAERDALRTAIGQNQYEGDVTLEDEKYFGLAVTSGSNPKRRSKSADALYDAARAHRMSPIQWRQWRRRSDEIQYWRDSIGAEQALVQSDQAPEAIQKQIEPEPLQSTTTDEILPINDDSNLQGDRITLWTLNTRFRKYKDVLPRPRSIRQKRGAQFYNRKTEVESPIHRLYQANTNHQ